MWPIIFNALRTYAPYIMWPVAAVVGVVGYNIERIVTGNKETPWKMKSISEEREDRLLEQLNDTKDVTEVESLINHKFVPGAVLDRNKKS